MRRGIVAGASGVRDRYSGVARVQVASGRRSVPQVSRAHRNATFQLPGAEAVFVRFVDGAGNRSTWHRSRVR